MQYPDLTEVAGRSKRYWDADGIPEIVMGGVWFVWGGGLLLQDSIPRSSRLSDLSSWIVLAAMLLTGLAANTVIKTLKNKYTFPRGGYVTFNAPSPARRLLAAVAAGLAAAVYAVLAVFAAKGHLDANAFAPAFAAAMAIGFLFVSMRPGMRHFIWFSLISLVLGAALYPLKLGLMAISWFFIGMGAPFIVSGICRLRAYVRNVPLQGGN